MNYILNKKYIKQLANGEIALDNSVRNLELLRRILKEAFPNDNSTIAGEKNYYYKSRVGWNASDRCWFLKDETIKLEHFLIKELPKDNFGIIVENNFHRVLNWFRENNYYVPHYIHESVCIFYIQGNDSVLYMKNDNNLKDTQLFTLEEIKQLEQNMEKLPEKWCIKQNLSEEVCDWFCKNTKSSPQMGGSFIYLHYNKTLKNISGEVYSNTIKEGYTEITLEQFKKLVLKENMENTQNKKIIGYIAPRDYFEGAVKKGDLYSNKSTSGLTWYPKNCNYALPKEIVETWEKCYENNFKIGDSVVFVKDVNSPKFVYILSEVKPNEFSVLYKGDNHKYFDYDLIRLATKEEIKAATIQLPRINNYEGKLEGDYIIYGNNCAKFHKSFFYCIKAEMTRNKSLGGNRNVKSITLDSNVVFTFEQIEQIVKYIDNQ